MEFTVFTSDKIPLSDQVDCYTRYSLKNLVFYF